MFDSFSLFSSVALFLLRICTQLAVAAIGCAIKCFLMCFESSILIVCYCCCFAVSSFIAKVFFVVLQFARFPSESGSVIRIRKKREEIFLECLKVYKQVFSNYYHSPVSICAVLFVKALVNLELI